eukprot:TRINITY_DN80966_c0_g1_i1.p1 TRINITY_DN80966_c0_g1~~TRINITY_DN80966_c0_g1_i1.p1  ORF type:complete len:472 (+),score=94.36 TRINITY_DN80966_c0_g1_i1:76-1416(+)
MAASVQQIMQSINHACRSRGGKYSGYSCRVVSWDDVSRGTVGGSLSCWGANITDTYLKSKDGAQLFTVRPDNWNERLGRVTTSEVALVAGNHVAGGGPLAPVTLRDFLKRAGTYGAYAGLPVDADLSKEALDAECSIRFQTTFLPISGAHGTMEFATEAYNYNTLSDHDPRNLVLLCTSQGVAVQQDGKGAKRLYHHAVDEDASIHRYWLEAERSQHKVGGQQQESAAEKADALARGKATASVIGTRAMGTRFNVLMTIQVPLQQKKPEARSLPMAAGCLNFTKEKSLSLGGGMWGADSDSSSDGESEQSESEDECMDFRCRSSSAPRRGVANAARVSRGSEFDVWSGLSVERPERNNSEHVTVTVVIYNTVADGVPTEEDVCAAIDDLEGLYMKCSTHGQLADSTFDFMKQELTVKDCVDIKTKVSNQPYKPPSQPVASHDVFPA